MKILIVEDDKTLNNGIALSFHSDTSIQAFTLAEADKMLNASIDLIILDINLPDGSGLDFCKKVREISQVPILFLTANDMEIDIVTGLESGADDYITKPFSLAVLRARVNAVLRRKKEEKSIFKTDKFMFNFEDMLFTVDNVAVELSKTEQKLLKLLVMNRGIILSREILLERVWSDGSEFVEENALSVTMNRLRSKLPDIPVKTVYGRGYVWEK